MGGPLLVLQARVRAIAQLGGIGWVVWFQSSLSSSLRESAGDWRSSAVWFANRFCNTDKASCNVAAILLVTVTWGMTFRMSSGVFTGSKISHVLRHERHLIQQFSLWLFCCQGGVLRFS